MGRRVAIWILSVLAIAGPANTEDREGAEAVTRHVLSVNWPAGFCATRPRRPECADPKARWRDAAAFSLHGLWQVRRSYCGVDEERRKALRAVKWTELPPLDLTVETRRRLDRAMPGAVSGLDRHQWTRNGICHGVTEEAYFRQSLDMLDRINASPVRALFAAKAGGTVTIAEVGQRFDQAFGPGAGARVRLRCRNVEGSPVVTGLTIGLGTLQKEKSFADLVLAAAKTNGRCKTGRVVAASGA